MMVVLEFFGSLSLVEILIFGFIGANMALTGTFMIQRGVRRLAEARAE